MSVRKEDVLAQDKEWQGHIDDEKSAVRLSYAVGQLLYDNSVELVLFRNHLVDRSTSEILKLHNYAKNVVEKEISVADSADLAKELTQLHIGPAKIDIGRLASDWKNEGANYDDKRSFLQDKLSNFLNEGSDFSIEPRDVVLFGFGRIGRLAARELIKQAGKGQQLRLKAIVVRNDSDEQLTKRAALFKMDSVHGEFEGSVDLDLANKCLIIDGQRIKLIAAPSPDQIDYPSYGINNAMVIDNTGAYTSREALSIHLKAKGISKVLLTAPGKEIPNIVYGVNNQDIDVENETIFSAASCTTNAISTVLKVIEDNLGVEKGHIETVHAYTNDQNLLDNMHKKPRRGRSAAINMVITSTGAGNAVAKVIPDLKGKLTANAVRVPTPNGSLAILSLNVRKETSVEHVNSLVKKEALEGNLVNQIYYSIEPELVSNDIIGNSCCSVFDSEASIASADGKNVVLYVWYDNEYGYTKQVIRLAKKIAKVQRRIYY